MLAPMQKRLPDTVDPFQLAAQGRRLEGSYPLADLDRLGDAVTDQAGSITATIQFGIDEQGVHYIEGRAQATLVVTCQRCLEPMHVPLDIALRMALVDAAKEAPYVRGDYEVAEVAARRLSLRTLIEDELLLALPIVAMHSRGQCNSSSSISASKGAEPAPKPANPFAVLARFRRR